MSPDFYWNVFLAYGSLPLFIWLLVWLWKKKKLKTGNRVFVTILVVGCYWGWFSVGNTMMNTEIKARRGDVQYQRVLGLNYLMGKVKDPADDKTWLYCPKNPVQAAFWLQLASKNGDALAKIHLGALYLNGLGVKKDPLVAQQLFDAVPKDYGKNFYAVGMLHQQGLIGDRSADVTSTLFEEASKRGFTRKSP